MSIESAELYRRSVIQAREIRDLKRRLQVVRAKNLVTLLVNNHRKLSAVVNRAGVVNRAEKTDEQSRIVMVI